jgi:hypothetical protein
MDSSKQIISDLQEKIGSDQPVDFLCAWKGVPVVVRGYLQNVQDDRITFRVEPMDSVCLMGQEHALLLHDIFISGIQGNIRDFDIKGGLLTLDSFTYVDRGFGGRSMVRVEPETPIEAALFVGETTIPCDVVDISLNGFGLLTESISGGAPPKGEAVTLKLRLLGEAVEISGKIRSARRQDGAIRLAMTFEQDAPGHTTVARYISQRRADIRREIREAYQKAVA